MDNRRIDGKQDRMTGGKTKKGRITGGLTERRTG
jgi:hypothetical protein